MPPWALQFKTTVENGAGLSDWLHRQAGRCRWILIPNVYAVLNLRFEAHRKIGPTRAAVQESAELVARRIEVCLLYTSPSPRDATLSRMPSSA